jgi:hypothetical protein
MRLIVVIFLLLGCTINPENRKAPIMAKAWAEQMLGKDAVVSCCIHGLEDWSECTAGLNGRLYMIKCVVPNGCFSILR